MDNLDQAYIAGIKVNELIEKYDLSIKDLKAFLPLNAKEFSKSNIQIHYFYLHKPKLFKIAQGS